MNPVSRRKSFPLLLLFFILSFASRWPGETSAAGKGEIPDSPYIIEEGSLPGVTWADDIHPVFTRNICVKCHLRGNELFVGDLREFKLGLIDPLDYENPFHSYHELVYAEAAPVIQDGETLRDGQCCWPRGYLVAKQRRIWIGHAERSALMHKLERDYFDWDHPPRFLEEGLRLRWGLPMPWVRPKGREEGVNGAIEVRSVFQQAWIYVRLWLGKYGDTVKLPPRISARDRDIIRYWIDNARELGSDGTGIEVLVVGPRGKPVKDAEITFIGNFNTFSVQEVRDSRSLRTGEDGTATLRFPPASVVTSFWFVRAEKDGRKTPYQAVTIREAETARVELAIPGN